MEQRAAHGERPPRRVADRDEVGAAALRVRHAFHALARVRQQLRHAQLLLDLHLLGLGLLGLLGPLGLVLLAKLGLDRALGALGALGGKDLCKCSTCWSNI